MRHRKSERARASTDLQATQRGLPQTPMAAITLSPNKWGKKKEKRKKKEKKAKTKEKKKPPNKTNNIKRIFTDEEVHIHSIH